MGHDGTEMCPALVLFEAPIRAIFTHGMHYACTTSHAACTPRAFHGIFFSFLVSQKKRKNEANAGWVQITRRRCKAPPGALLPEEHAAMRLLQKGKATAVGSGGRSQVCWQQEVNRWRVSIHSSSKQVLQRPTELAPRHHEVRIQRVLEDLVIRVPTACTRRRGHACSRAHRR